MTIRTDIQQQVYDLLSRASDVSFVSAERTSEVHTAFSPGQRLQAEVMAHLPNSRTQIQVGGERFNLELPQALRPGQSLEITFVTDIPRITFAIARQGGGLSQPVSLSDASRLLSLLIGNEHLLDAKVRSSLQSIGDILRRSSATDAGVLANLMDEAIVYGAKSEVVKASPDLQQERQEYSSSQRHGFQGAALKSFEENAARILQHIAKNSRFILAEAVNQPLSPLPLLPGEEVDGVVLETLPGGRVFVQIAGSSLELSLPRQVKAGEILRLTYITDAPKPLFALPRQNAPVATALSEAGRWLSDLEHGPGELSDNQARVLSRLDSIVHSLPPSSPVFMAIEDEAATYGGPYTSRSSQHVGQLPPDVQHQEGFSGKGIVLSEEMPRLLQALIKGNRLALVELQNQSTLPSGFTLGQQMKGEVLAALGGGRFLVRAAGMDLEFMLPKGIVRGDRLSLYLVSAMEPENLFLMMRAPAEGATQVSVTGKWLSGLLESPNSPASAPQQAPGIMATLLSTLPTESSEVSNQLRQGLKASGLFYESHLARWFGGDYPLAELRKEPQACLNRQESTFSSLLQEAQGAFGSGALSPLGDLEILFKEAGIHGAGDSGVEPEILPLVKDQLSILQHGPIQFRGELFPGQPLEWTVEEREAEQALTGERHRSWSTKLTLNLPVSGTITTKVTLLGSQVNVEVVTASSATAQHLEIEKHQLTDQLEAAGLTSESIRIRQS